MKHILWSVTLLSSGSSAYAVNLSELKPSDVCIVTKYRIWLDINDNARPKGLQLYGEMNYSQLASMGFPIHNDLNVSKDNTCKYTISPNLIVLWSQRSSSSTFSISGDLFINPTVFERNLYQPRAYNSYHTGMLSESDSGLDVYKNSALVINIAVELFIRDWKQSHP